MTYHNISGCQLARPRSTRLSKNFPPEVARQCSKRMTRHLFVRSFCCCSHKFEVLFEPEVPIHNTCLILLVTYGAVSGTRGFLDQVDDESSRLLTIHFVVEVRRVSSRFGCFGVQYHAFGVSLFTGFPFVLLVSTNVALTCTRSELNTANTEVLAMVNLGMARLHVTFFFFRPQVALDECRGPCLLAQWKRSCIHLLLTRSRASRGGFKELPASVCASKESSVLGLRRDVDTLRSSCELKESSQPDDDSATAGIRTAVAPSRCPYFQGVAYRELRLDVSARAVWIPTETVQVLSEFPSSRVVMLDAQRCGPVSWCFLTCSPVQTGICGTCNFRQCLAFRHVSVLMSGHVQSLL